MSEIGRSGEQQRSALQDAQRTGASIERACGEREDAQQHACRDEGLCETQQGVVRSAHRLWA